MTKQVRIYTINRGQLQAFAREWREKILPLRRELGFQVEGAWLLEEPSQFVWVLSYEGSDSWEARDAAYYTSPQRRAMDPNPARLIARAEEYFAEAVTLPPP
jgi:hypothetical protein